MASHQPDAWNYYFKGSQGKAAAERTEATGGTRHFIDSLCLIAVYEGSTNASIVFQVFSPCGESLSSFVVNHASLTRH